MNRRISKIKNDVQDRNCKAWEMLCEYVDRVAEEEIEEFVPLNELGVELYSEIYTLPTSIKKLVKVKRVLLYGSKLKRIPAEIGQMSSLEYFDPYTSYDLHWFPFEMIYCEKLKDSRVSTRALYGNVKNRIGFPRLKHNPVSYFEEKVDCSVCKNEIEPSEIKQMWITSLIGTDYLPLLVNLCGSICENKLNEIKKPPLYYWQYPHQGGTELDKPEMTFDQYTKLNAVPITLEEIKKMIKDKKSNNPRIDIK